MQFLFENEIDLFYFYLYSLYIKYLHQTGSNSKSILGWVFFFKQIWEINNPAVHYVV